MATSSIFHSFVIEGEERVERFINAIEASMNEVIPDTPPAGHLLEDPKEREDLLAQLRKKYGSKK